MRSAKAMMLVAVVAVLAVCFVPMGDADASTNVDISTSGFDSMHGGSIYVDFSNTDTEFKATVKVTEDSKVWYDEEVTVEKGECSIEIYLGNMKNEGDHSLLVTFTPAPGSSGDFKHDSKIVNIHVDNNILSNWSTYLIIIIAVIVIAAILYLRMRDKPKAENTMTFEQLEEERKAEMAAKSEKKKGKGYTAPASSTERKKYTGNKKKE